MNFSSAFRRLYVKKENIKIDMKCLRHTSQINLPALFVLAECRK